MAAPKFPCYKFTTALPLQLNTSIKSSSKRLLGMSIKAAGREPNERDYWGRLVDENMITLRMRIREVKMLQKGDGDHQPSDWMEWEKKHFMHYNNVVCEGVGLLQNYMLNTRPTLALGMVALAALSVPISISVVFFPVFQVAEMIVSAGFHV